MFKDVTTYFRSFYEAADLGGFRFLHAGACERSILLSDKRTKLVIKSDEIFGNIFRCLEWRRQEWIIEGEEYECLFHQIYSQNPLNDKKNLTSTMFFECFIKKAEYKAKYTALVASSTTRSRPTDRRPDRRTDRRSDGPMDGQADPLIESLCWD